MEAVATARTLRPLFAKQSTALGGAGVASLGVVAADLAKPWPIALVIDELLVGREGGFELGSRDVRVLAAIAGLVVVIALVDALATYLSDLWLQRAGERINHDLRVATYAHLQRLSLGYHQRKPKGDLVTRVTGDVDAVGRLFADSLGPIVQSVLLLLGVLAVSMVLDPLLTLVTFAMAPVLALLSFRYRRRVRAAARRQRRQDGEIASLADEALSAMPVVKAFGSEDYEHERVERRSAKRMDLGVEVARLQARFDGLVGVLTAVSMALVVVVGVMRVAAGALSPGDLVVFASYARKLTHPLRAIAKETTRMSRALARADRIAEVLATDEVLEDRPGAWHGGRARGAVRLEDVGFGYTPDRPVLHGVSLEIEPGSCVALVGPSGSGKSTIAALIARFYDPRAGRVLIDDRDARGCAVDWVRSQIGVLLQDTILFRGTVAENIAYATDAGRDDVVAAARTAAAHDFIESLPEGYDTELGPQGVGLSGGQRQRIGIARTLLRDPAILVLDEPTTGLDSESQAQVVGGLLRLMEGRTTILITHSPELARRADRVIEVEDGHIAGERDSGGRAPRRKPPPDPALPQLGSLLDPAAITPALERSLSPGAALEGVDIERVRYRPGRRLIVQYRVRVDGEAHGAVATAYARAAPKEHVVLARHADAIRAAERSPAAVPVAYDEGVRAFISWLPVDPRLPALAATGAELGRRLRSAGVDVPGDGGEPEILRYKPGARAVLRLDGHVIKAYASDRQFDKALSGLRVAREADAAHAPPLEAALPSLRLIAQTAVDGTVPSSAASAAPVAAGFLRALHGAEVDGLRPMAPRDTLVEAGRYAERAAAIRPNLRARIRAFMTRLEQCAPAGLPLVPAHGDFHAQQLLLHGDGLTVTDFDDLCAAPAAQDLATYAADVVKGDERDDAALDAVLEPLLAAYGDIPDGFDWYLARAIFCRSTHPFAVWAEDWPARVDAIVERAEEVLAR